MFNTCIHDGCEQPTLYQTGKMCSYHQHKKWYDQNPEKVREIHRNWRNQNRDTVRAYARKHAAKNRNNPVTEEHITDKVKERFFAKVDKTDTCWNWTGARTAYRPKRKFAPATKGYGTITVNGRPFYAHRLSWLMHKGPLIPGLVIDHLCENTLCVNPDHMQQVTNLENTMRSEKHTANGAVYNRYKDYCKYGHKRGPEMQGKECQECYRSKHRKRDGYCKRGHWRGPEMKGKPCKECQKQIYRSKKNEQ